MAETEIASKARFDIIRYAQVWEDADILVEALRPGPNDTVVSIASAGDNALALLAEEPKRVIAVDLNPAQLACVRLRAAIYRHMSHGELLELMGSRQSDRRRTLLDEATRHLDPDDHRFWQERAEAVESHGIGGVGKFEAYFRTFRTAVLPFIHNRETVSALLKPRTPEERVAFYDKSWNIWGWRWMLKGFFSRTVMGWLGRDPSFFAHVEGSAADQVARLTRHALVEQDPSQNPYLRWILKGDHHEALPRALRAENFTRIRDNLDKLEVRLCTAEALAEEGVKADCFNLSDIFEYMGPEAHTAAYASVLAVANPGARIAYWNMMAPRRAPASLASCVKVNDALVQKLKPTDKAFFYRDFIIEEVR